MFWTRVASAVILAPIFLALVYLEYPYFHVMIGAIAGMMAWEFTRMDGKVGLKRRIFMTLASIATIAAVAMGWVTAAIGIVAAAVVLAIAADQIAGRRGLHVVQMAAAYAALPAVCLLFVIGVGNRESIYWILAVVWATDIGAYIVGRLLKGPKLAPGISPNKTWSGAVGGLLCAVAASFGLFSFYDFTFTPLIVPLTMLMSVISQGGDLFESALKRRYQVKDSGALIPGHGGAMDRFDGLWAAAPLTALFCAILGGGVQHW